MTDKPHGEEGDTGWSWLKSEIAGEHKNDLHLTPMNDLRRHIIGPKCWCEPEEGDGCRYLHAPADGRNDYEEGRRKPH